MALDTCQKPAEAVYLTRDENGGDEGDGGKGVLPVSEVQSSALDVLERRLDEDGVDGYHRCGEDA
jgi:hypothetical protein